jgi:WD40 repeat protein
LRVFDILSDKPSRTVRLEPRTCHTSAGDPANYEVTRPSFSPDGIYLAVPRSDNTTHVYDYRFMSTERGPLAAYAHGPSKTLVEGAGQHHVPCGVVQARWVGSAFGCSRLGLLTGGDDGATPRSLAGSACLLITRTGCVRVWDVGKSIEDHSGGRVLVEVPDDISYFTLGKVWNGQKRLVV